MKKQLKAVLFDLDGTLLDTAPDLAYALNQLLIANKHQPITVEDLRPHAGHGGKAFIKLGFGIDDNHPNFVALWKEFLVIYSQHVARATQLFPGMDQVLDFLQQNQLAWGIVTNKPTHLAEPLLKHLKLNLQTNCVVCGDTLSKRKPDPASLIYACELLRVAASDCVYIGDAAIDIEAGKAANMQTLAAAYGYLAQTDDPLTWNADTIIYSPQEIISWLNQ